MVIPQGVHNIDGWAFSGRDALVGAAMPDSVASIGDYAFYNCSGLTSVVIPNSVTSIGSWAFYYCRELSSVVFEGNAPTTGRDPFANVSSDCIAYANLGSTGWGVNIPGTWKGIRIVYVPEKVKYTTEHGSQTWLESNSITDNGMFVGFEGQENAIDVVIPVIDSLGYPILGIGRLDNLPIESLTISNGIDSIAESAFEQCNNLHEVTLLGKTMGQARAMSNFSWGLKHGSVIHCTDGDITINRVRYTTSLGGEWHEADATINNGVFGGFVGKEDAVEVLLPENAGIRSIGNNVFENCSSLTAITIPNDVTSIGSYAFSGCSGLANISIPDDVKTIGDFAFSGCTSLVVVDVPNGVTSIGRHAFRDCTNITSVSIPDSVTSIGGYAFYNCTNLANVRIPNGVTTV